MEPSGFPLEKTNGQLPELSKRAEQGPAVYRYVGLREDKVAAAPVCKSFLDYWHILIRHKMALLCFALAGLIAAILFSLAQTPLYRARTSLEIQDFNENFLDLKSLNPTDSTGNYGTAESYVATQIKILQSESLLERVIDKLELREAPPATGRWAFVSRARQKLRLSSPSRFSEKEELIRQAERNLTVSATGRTRLLEVLYLSPDPNLAADFANTLVSQFIEQSQEMRWKSTQRTAEWLTSHLDEMKAKLEQSEAELQDYARSSGLTITSERDNVAEIRLKELQEELSKAQADRIAKQAKLEEAERKPADSLPEMLEDMTLRDYRVKLTDLQRQLVELSATLTPAHYKVQRVEAQIAELQSAFQTQRGLILRRIASEDEAARRRETLLAKAQAVQEKIVADQSSKAIHYNMLKREVDSSRQLYESMLQRVKQASLAAAMRASNVLVVDPAKAPLLPYKPSLPKNSVLGLFSGVLLGLGFIFLRESFDPRIRAPGDVQIYLNLPELGVIPLAELPASRQNSKGFGVLPRLALASGIDQVSSPDDCPELATWQRKPSLLAECVRTALTSILLPSKNGDHPRVVVITSPCPGDGKTTVASNLSIAMAEIRQKVVLIDGDLRRPRLHKVFGISNDWGLSDVLGTGTPLETIPIANLVCETKVSGLYVLAGGRGAITTSPLLYSARMSRLLDYLRREFDMVLIDAPPVIHLADARVLGRLADGIVLVIRAGETTSESAMIACQRFAEDGSHVLGTILNSWDPKAKGRYGYSYDYQGAYSE
jgi:succinoglycan biosynthesis transport protein ExoP